MPLTIRRFAIALRNGSIHHDEQRCAAMLHTHDSSVVLSNRDLLGYNMKRTLGRFTKGRIIPDFVTFIAEVGREFVDLRVGAVEVAGGDLRQETGRFAIDLELATFRHRGDLAHRVERVIARFEMQKTRLRMM